MGVTLHDDLTAYAVDIVRGTRNHDSILVGAGPRATQALVLAARVFSILDGRDYVTPDDVKEVAGSVLAHRLILRPEYEIEGTTVEEAVAEILQAVAVPR
jgi:MoxR-like ATPase